MALGILLGLLVLLVLIWAARRWSFGKKADIRSAAGMQYAGYVTLGGIGQYVQVRGQDRANPVLIVLHGGPGSPMAYYSHDWQAELERDYTIVHWDQRGCGNTYYRDPGAERPTFELLLSDLDELVDHVRAVYGKDRVVILGHSWGTLLGGVYAGRHPEKVAAYVGAGQFSDVWESERCAAEEAARRAEEAGRPGDAEKIQAQFQRLRGSQTVDMRELMKLRQQTGKYLPSGDNTPFLVRLFSPNMTFSDLKWFLMPLFRLGRFVEIQEKLYDRIYSGYGSLAHDFTQYEVPVIIIAGDCDWITPYCRVREFFDGICAPAKEFITIEAAGHIPFRPGRFPQALQNALSRVL